jgi:hypothetical protein
MALTRGNARRFLWEPFSAEHIGKVIPAGTTSFEFNRRNSSDAGSKPQPSPGHSAISSPVHTKVTALESKIRAAVRRHHTAMARSTRCIRRRRRRAGAPAGSRLSAGSPAARLQRGKHNVRPCKQLGDLRCDIRERFGSTIVGAVGQTIRTTAGMLSGSTSSTRRWSWLTSAEANGVMG